MTDYTKLVKALRYCAESGDFNCNKDCPMYPNYPKCLTKMDIDAAAAIEDMAKHITEMHERVTVLQIARGELEAEVKRLEPKRGKWITHQEVKNIYGGVYIECPFCGEKYVVQNVSDEKFCRNCGADLRCEDGGAGMSYDIRLGVKAADADGLIVEIARPEYESPTYNLREMFVACMNWDYTQSEWYKVTDVLPKIERGIHELTFNAKKYRKYNPSNGWGDLQGALECLKSVLECIQHNTNGWENEIPIEHLWYKW